MNTTIYNRVKEYFSKLSPEGTHEYEKKIFKYSELCANPEYVEVFQYMISSDDEWGYEAFYLLCSYYRRNKDYVFMNDLIQRNRKFENHLTYNHILVQYMVHSESFYDYEELLKMAFEDAMKMNDVAGFQQAFCNAFATICEQCNENDKQFIMSKWYDCALDRVNRAIVLDPGYAKFYCTKARILGFKNRFIEAQQLLNQAISLEDSSRADYALTIMTYQNYKLAISIQKQRYEFTKELQNIQKMINTSYDKKNIATRGDKESHVTKSQLFHVYEGDKPYAFISYAHSDSQQVFPLLNKLQQDGLRIWIDHGITFGEEWPEEIGEHLIHCQVVIVFLSFNSILSANVRREITMAVNEHKKIIAIVMDSVKLTPGMQLQLGLCQMLNLYQYSENQLMKQLNSLLLKEGDVYE